MKNVRAYNLQDLYIFVCHHRILISGYIFWTDWGSEPHIGRSDMNGKNAIKIPLKFGAWPNAIALNHESGELFCIDSSHKDIYKLNYDGSNKKVITIPSSDHSRPFDLDYIVEQNLLVWTDQRADGLFLGKLDENHNVIESIQKVGRSQSTLFGVSVISHKNQLPMTTNNCTGNNSCTDGFCLHIPDNSNGVQKICLNRYVCWFLLGQIICSYFKSIIFIFL